MERRRRLGSESGSRGQTAHALTASPGRGKQPPSGWWERLPHHADAQAAGSQHPPVGSMPASIPRAPPSPSSAKPAKRRASAAISSSVPATQDIRGPWPGRCHLLLPSHAATATTTAAGCGQHPPCIKCYWHKRLRRKSSLGTASSGALLGTAVGLQLPHANDTHRTTRMVRRAWCEHSKSGWPARLEAACALRSHCAARRCSAARSDGVGGW